MSKITAGGFFARPIHKLLLLIASIAGLTIACSSLNAAEVTTDTRLVTKNAECSAVGTIWWNELLVPETKSLEKFYSSVFGWKSKFVDVSEQKSPPSSEKDKYTIFMSGDQEIAGMMNENHLETLKSQKKGWLIYFQVANVRDAVKAAELQGGTIIQRPFEIADGHQIAIIRDPGDNVFGVVTPADAADCKKTASNQQN